MLFVIVGVLIIAMNVVGIGPVADWNWDITGDLWKFCVPFVLAIMWWIWADKSGLDKRREMEKMEEQEEGREPRAENLDALSARKTRSPPQGETADRRQAHENEEDPRSTSIRCAADGAAAQPGSGPATAPGA